jgi:hypothetical protein
LAIAEAKIGRGCLDEASRLLDDVDGRCLRAFAITDLAFATLLRAEVALQRGEDASAERLALGAYLVLKGRHHAAYRCQVTIARARLRLDEPWSPPSDVGRLPDSAWDRVALDIEHARHMLAIGQRVRAREAATNALLRSEAAGYAGLAARSAATIGATYPQATTERGAWHLRAISALLHTQSRATACDLFATDRTGFDFSSAWIDDVADVVYDALVKAVPQLDGCSEREARAGRSFIRYAVVFVFAGRRSPERSSEAIHALASRGGMFAQYLSYFAPSVADLIETATLAITGFEHRARAEFRLNALIRELAAKIVPSADVRKYAIG